MLRRTLLSASLTLFAAAPLAAQAKMETKADKKADKKMDHMDMDNKVKGGPLPAGWSGRMDDASAKITDAKFVTMGKGFHVTTGPAAIYWTAKDKVSGPFIATATLSQTKAPDHPEAYGIFVGGKNLESPNQTYFYFLVRGDGKFMVNHRAGAEVHKIVAWTDNAAIKKADAKGAATNTLTADASKADSVRLKVNGVQVAALSAKDVASNGQIVGLRVNHHLDVHISDFTVVPKKSRLRPATGDSRPVAGASRCAGLAPTRICIQVCTPRNFAPQPRPYRTCTLPCSPPSRSRPRRHRPSTPGSASSPSRPPTMAARNR
jgi:hypothetical protein